MMNLSRFVYRSDVERRIVGIPMSVATIKGLAVVWVERSMRSNTRHKIRVRNKQPSECNRSGMTRFDVCRCGFGRISIGRDNRTIEKMAEQFGVVERVDPHHIGTAQA